MKNATKGPLIVVTLGTLMIVGAFLFSAKKDGSKEGGWKLPDNLPPPPQQQPQPQGSVFKDGVEYGPGCTWIRIVNPGVFAATAIPKLAAASEAFAPDSNAVIALRELLRVAVACVSNSMYVHDVDGSFSVNALINHIGDQTIEQVLAGNVLGTHPPNSLLGVIKTTLQGIRPTVLS